MALVIWETRVCDPAALGLAASPRSYGYTMKTLDPNTPTSLDLPFPLLRSEPDRDIFDLGGHLLIAAMDSLSAHGQTLRQPIPLKGRILSRLTRFWFRATRDIVTNPMTALSADGVPEGLQPLWPALAWRSTLLRKIPCHVQCAVHGCLTGAAFEEYEARGSVGSTQLPPRLRRGARLQAPIFVPFLDVEDGRRRFLSMSELADLVGIKAVHQLKACSLALFMRGYHLAWEREIILADARFSFGWREDGTLILADEALTPGTSRYWSTRSWKPNVEPARMERRDLIDYLDAEVKWNGEPPLPHLPDHVVEAIQTGYLNLARRFGIVP